jgi:hypothetical protein
MPGDATIWVPEHFYAEAAAVLRRLELNEKHREQSARLDRCEPRRLLHPTALARLGTALCAERDHPLRAVVGP